VKNDLADKYQVALILRLTLDGQRVLMHGEVVDLEGRLIGRFADWENLMRVMRSWLITLQEDAV